MDVNDKNIGNDLEWWTEIWFPPIPFCDGLRAQTQQNRRQMECGGNRYLSHSLYPSLSRLTKTLLHQSSFEMS